LVGKLKTRAGDFVLLASFSLAMSLEVGMITLQQWRGVASHFNRSTPFDANVLVWVELLVIFATIVIADLTRRSFQPLETSSDMTLAVRGGMCLLLFSCMLGFLLVLHGNQQIAIGRSPEIFGAAGAMKFPHGVPMHAIQFLPLLAWLLRTLGAAEKQRFRALASALLSLLTFTGFTLMQTFTGRSRFELWWPSGLVLAGSAILITIPLCTGLAHAVRRIPRPTWRTRSM
jgi:hypothetical protein